MSRDKKGVNRPFGLFGDPYVLFHFLDERGRSGNWECKLTDAAAGSSRVPLASGAVQVWPTNKYWQADGSDAPRISCRRFPARLPLMSQKTRIMVIACAEITPVFVLDR